MAENKDGCQEGQGCGGCGCGCAKPENAEVQGHSAKEAGVGAQGEMIARSAIEEMVKPVEADPGEGLCVAEQDVDSFICECEKSGKNPLEVIQFVAKKNGISLTGKAPKGKEYISTLLKAALKKVLVGFLQYIVDQYGLGAVQAVIGMLKGDKEDKGDSAGEYKGDKQDPKFARGCAPQGKVVRLVPVRIGYAVEL